MRATLFWTLGAFVIGFILTFVFRISLTSAILTPQVLACGGETELLYTSPQEAFWVTINLALWVGLMFATPILIWCVVKGAARPAQPDRQWVLLLLLAAIFAVAAVYGFSTLHATFETICGGAGGYVPSVLHVDTYMGVAKWRPFLYGLSALIPAAALMVWRRSRPR